MQEKLRILCVDDDAAGLMIRTMLLERFGYEVIPADTGEKAMSILAAEGIDLAIVDYCLGSMTGTELAERMKKQQPELRIILLSGAMDISEGLENIDRFLLKGEGPQRLAALVRLLTEEKNEHAA
jgi:DNA-binding NtrC family response regulator